MEQRKEMSVGKVIDSFVHIERELSVLSCLLGMSTLRYEITAHCVTSWKVARMSYLLLHMTKRRGRSQCLLGQGQGFGPGPIYERSSQHFKAIQILLYASSRIHVLPFRILTQIIYRAWKALHGIQAIPLFVCVSYPRSYYIYHCKITCTVDRQLEWL